MKANPWRLVRAHFETFVDARTGIVRFRDYASFVALPVAIFVLGCLVRVELPRAVTVGLLTVAGLMGAFLFGAMLQVAMRAMTWADDAPEPGSAASRHASFLSQIAANAGYAALVCVLTSTTFVVASVIKGDGRVIVSALGLALAAHLGLMLLLVTVRIFALTQERLRDVRTGQASVTPLPSRNAGVRK